MTERQKRLLVFAVDLLGDLLEDLISEELDTEIGRPTAQELVDLAELVENNLL